MNVTTIAVIGQTDSGKSTLIGKLLIDSGSVPAAIVRRVKKLCKDRKTVFQPAYLVDYMREEQRLSSTLERALATLQLKDNRYLIVDTPGQLMLSKKMVSGLADADIALIVLNVQDKDLKNYRFYFKLTSLLHIPHSFIVINKIDLIDYNMRDYLRFVERLHKENRHIRKTRMFPVSALYGDNLLGLSNRLPEPKGTALSEELVSTAAEIKKAQTSGPFLMSVQGVINFREERVALGTVTEGTISVGDSLNCSRPPMDSKLLVKKIYHDGITVSAVSRGENAGLVLEEGLHKVTRGDLLYSSRKPLTYLPHIDVRLYVIEPFLADKHGFQVYFFGKNYSVKKIEIKRRFDFQLTRVDNSVAKIALNDFLEAKIAFDSRSFPCLPKRWKAVQFELRDKNSKTVAIGVIH